MKHERERERGVWLAGGWLGSFTAPPSRSVRPKRVDWRAKYFEHLFALSFSLPIFTFPSFCARETKEAISISRQARGSGWIGLRAILQLPAYG